MSVSIWYLVFCIWEPEPLFSALFCNGFDASIKPIAIPATGALMGTPASISARVDAQTDAIEVEPFDASDSDTMRIVYGNASLGGTTGRSAFSARAPCPIMRRFMPPRRPVSPVENGRNGAP